MFGCISVLPEGASGWQLFRCVKAGMLPFLRSAALFFHYLNSTAPPADLLGNYRNTHMQKYDANMIVVLMNCVNVHLCVCSCRPWSVGGAVQLSQSALQPAASLLRPTHSAGAPYREVHTPTPGHVTHTLDTVMYLYTCLCVTGGVVIQV